MLTIFFVLPLKPPISFYIRSIYAVPSCLQRLSENGNDYNYS